MSDLFPLSTERLELRLHRPADIDWLVEVYSQPEVARFLLDDPWTEVDAVEALSKRLARTDLYGDAGAVDLVIERDHQPIGGVALWLTDRERRVAEMGWVIDPVHGLHGFASEAVRGVLVVAFDHYRLHRVTAQMDARNTASAKLAAAVGMQLEAQFRQDCWSKGEWTDTFVYAQLANDPR